MYPTLSCIELAMDYHQDVLRVCAPVFESIQVPLGEMDIRRHEHNPVLAGET